MLEDLRNVVYYSNGKALKTTIMNTISNSNVEKSVIL